MFKSRRRKLRINKKPKRQRKSPLLVLGSIPLLLIILEIFARLFFSFTGEPASIAEQPDPSPLHRAYQVQFFSDEKPIQGLPQGGELKVERTPGLGYQIQPNQKSDFWQINQQGWREKQSIPQNKPNDQVRVFLLGGSTAFGYGTQSNQETIAQQLEARLNQRVQQQQSNPDQYQPKQLPFYKPDRERLMQKEPRIREGNYQVINAAVPGYMSRNQLSQMALEILPYDPDLIIVLGGYEDLTLESEKSFADIPAIDNYLSDPFQHFTAYLSKPFQDFVQNIYLLRMALDWGKPSEGNHTANALVLQYPAKQPLASYLPQQSELGARVERYRQNQRQMIRLAAGAKVPVLSAIQPEITGRNLDDIPTEEEAEIINQLGDSYVQKVRNTYPELEKANNELAELFPNNVTSVNLNPTYQDFPKPAFVDPIHLTADGNQQAAQTLYQTIAKMPKMQITPTEP